MPGTITLANLIVNFRSNTAQFRSDLKKATKQTDSFAKRLGRTEIPVRALQGALLGLGVSVGGIATGIVKANREFERLDARLRTTERSSAGAARAFDRLLDFAVKTPFEINEITDSFVQLRIRGAQPTTEMLTGLGNVAAAFGRDIGEVTDAITSLVAGMVRPIRRFGFQASVEGENVSLAFGDMRKVVERDAQAIADAIVELTRGRVGGAMERMMETINGAVSNLADSAFKLAVVIGKTGGLNEAINGSVRSLDELLVRLSQNQAAIKFLTQTAMAAARALIAPFTAIVRLLFNVGQQVGEVANAMGALLARDFEAVREAARRMEKNWRDMGDALNDNKESWQSLLDVVTSTPSVAGVVQETGDAAVEASSGVDQFSESLAKLGEEARTIAAVLPLGLPSIVGPGGVRIRVPRHQPRPPSGGLGRAQDVIPLRGFDRGLLPRAGREAGGLDRFASTLASSVGRFLDPTKILSTAVGNVVTPLVNKITDPITNAIGGLFGVVTDLERAIIRNTDALFEMTEGLGGRFALERTRLAALDITDPMSRFAALRDVVEQQLAFPIGRGVLGNLLRGLTPENIGQRIADIIGAITEGRGGFSGRRLREDLARRLAEIDVSVDDFFSVLTEMERLADETGRAADEVSRFGEELRNVPTGFKTALRQFQATEGVQVGSASRVANNSFTFNVSGVEDPKRFVDLVESEIQRRAQRGGTSPVFLFTKSMN